MKLTAKYYAKTDTYSVSVNDPRLVWVPYSADPRDEQLYSVALCGIKADSEQDATDITLKKLLTDEVKLIEDPLWAWR